MQVSDIAKLNVGTNQTLEAVGKNPTDQKLMAVSKEFESIFTGMVFKEMKKTSSSLGGKDMFYGGMGEDIFKDMLYDKYALDAAQTNSIGLAKVVYDSLKARRGSL